MYCRIVQTLPTLLTILPTCCAAICPTLIDATIEQLQDGLTEGSFSSVDLVRAYIARTNEVNGTLRAVTESNPDALDIAQTLDDERAQGKIRGPLHGLPILIKGNIATNDSLSTTAGSYALLGTKVSRDATTAAKLRKAGAIILGKANLSQWAAFRSFNTSMGWSSYGGQTTGAYLADQDPNGSSSGSAVAVSVGLAVAALGTETYGSILLPAGANNVVGIKPTVGLTSRDLVVPISEHADSVGPIARTVLDAAYILQAIAGPDPKDNYTLANPNAGAIPDYIAACKNGTLQNRRLGVPYNVLTALYNTTTPEMQAFNDVLLTLTASGATIVPANFTLLTDYLTTRMQSVLTAFAADFVTNLPQYLSQLTSNPNNITTLQDVVDFTHSTPVEEYPLRDTGIFDIALALGIDNTSPLAYEARQNLTLLGGEGGLLGALARNDLDAVVLPTSIAYQFANILGTPAISVPLGRWPADTEVRRNAFGNLVNLGPGYPFGLTFLGGSWEEEKLIGIACGFERVMDVRSGIVPVVMPTTELECSESWNSFYV